MKVSGNVIVSFCFDASTVFMALILKKKLQPVSGKT